MIVLPFIVSGVKAIAESVALPNPGARGSWEPVFHEFATLPTAAVSNEQPQKKCVFRNRVHADNLTHDEKECEKSVHSHQQANAYELVANKRVSPSSEGIRTQ